MSLSPSFRSADAPEGLRSKFVELFGSNTTKSKTLPICLSPKDSTDRLKCEKSNETAEATHGYFGTAKSSTAPLAERVSSKISRRPSNPSKSKAKVDHSGDGIPSGSKNNNNSSISLQRGKAVQERKTCYVHPIPNGDNGLKQDATAGDDGDNTATTKAYARDNNSKKVSRSGGKKENKVLTASVHLNNFRQQSSSFTNFSSESNNNSFRSNEPEEDEDNSSCLIKKITPNAGESITENGPKAPENATSHGVEPIRPMEPIERFYNNGTSLLNRISQRYMIDPAKATPSEIKSVAVVSRSDTGINYHNNFINASSGSGSGDVNSRKSGNGSGSDNGNGSTLSLYNCRMNKSLNEGLKTVAEDAELSISSSNSSNSDPNNVNISKNNVLKTFKPMLEGMTSNQKSPRISYGSVEVSKSQTSDSGSGSSFSLDGDKFCGSYQHTLGRHVRYERSNSMPTSASNHGSVNGSTSLLPSLTLTSIPEKTSLDGSNRNPGERRSFLMRPRVLDLGSNESDYGKLPSARQSLDSYSFVPQLSEAAGGGNLQHQQQQLKGQYLGQQYSPMKDAGNRLNSASSSFSSSSSLLSPPACDLKRFHSSLPRATKSFRGSGSSPLDYGGLTPVLTSPAVEGEKGFKEFNFPSSNSTSRLSVQRGVFGQSSLQGSQSCSLTRKNLTFDLLDQSSFHHQQQQQQQQHLFHQHVSSGSKPNNINSSNNLTTDDDGDLHASVLSLISNTSSSIFSTTTEERQAQEIKKLKHQLEGAQEKISSLTSQLNTNAYVVGAFEHSLATMTTRLQKLSKSSEMKDVELTKLKSTLDEIERAQGQMSRTFSDHASNRSPLVHGKHKRSPENEYTTSSTPQGLHSQVSCESMERKRKNMIWTKLGHTFKKAFSKKKEGSDSETDVSCSSEFISSPKPIKTPELPFRRHSNHHLTGYRSVPSTPLVSHRRLLDFFESPSGKNSSVVQKACLTLKSPSSNTKIDFINSINNNIINNINGFDNQKTDNNVDNNNATSEDDRSSETEQLITSLRQQLHEKDMGLTDVRLEALSSAHLLEQLRETLNQLKVELSQEKTENERLQKILREKGIDVYAGNYETKFPVRSKSNVTDQSKLLIKNLSSFDNIAIDEIKKNVPRYVVSVQVGHLDKVNSYNKKEIPVGTVSLTSKTKWETLDATVHRIFQEYLYKLDPSGCLGLSSKSIVEYSVGEIRRTKGDDKVPELLPFGYLVGHNTTIIISLATNLDRHKTTLEQSAFDLLLSKSFFESCLSVLQDQHNIIISAPPKSCKTRLLHELCRLLSPCSNNTNNTNNINNYIHKTTTPHATTTTYVDINNLSAEELKLFLFSSSSSSASPPSSSSPSSLKSGNIIVLDNLTYPTLTSPLFEKFLETQVKRGNYLLGTIVTSQLRASNGQLPSKLQVRVLDSQSDPLQGLLSRYLQRRVINEEINQGRKIEAELVSYLKYIVQVHNHLCAFIRDGCEKKADEIGAAMFFTAPLDKSQFQSWFADLWNETFVPHLTFALAVSHVKVTNQTDPTLWILDNLPWKSRGLLTLPSSPTPDLLITSPKGVSSQGQRVNKKNDGAESSDKLLKDGGDKCHKKAGKRNDYQSEPKSSSLGFDSSNYKLSLTSPSSSPSPSYLQPINNQTGQQLSSSVQQASSPVTSPSPWELPSLSPKSSSSSSSPSQSSSSSPLRRPDICTTTEVPKSASNSAHVKISRKDATKDRSAEPKVVDNVDDPLTNMIHKLQEAAMTSSVTSQEVRGRHFVEDDDDDDDVDVVDVQEYNKSII